MQCITLHTTDTAVLVYYILLHSTQWWQSWTGTKKTVLFRLIQTAWYGVQWSLHLSSHLVPCVWVYCIYIFYLFNSCSHIAQVWRCFFFCFSHHQHPICLCQSKYMAHVCLHDNKCEIAVLHSLLRMRTKQQQQPFCHLCLGNSATNTGCLHAAMTYTHTHKTHVGITYY